MLLNHVRYRPEPGPKARERDIEVTPGRIKTEVRDQYYAEIRGQGTPIPPAASDAAPEGTKQNGKPATDEQSI